MNTKLFYKLSSVLSVLLVFAACSSDEEPYIVNDAQQKTVVMKFDGIVENFDGGKTKASSVPTWKDGQTLYLKMKGLSDNYVYGTAVFVESDQHWDMHYSGTLIEDADQPAEILFFSDATVEGDIVKISPKSPVYKATNATYKLSTEQVLYISGVLIPLTSRVNFNRTGHVASKLSDGEIVKDSFRVGNLEYYSEYNLSNHSLAKTKGFVDASRTVKNVDGSVIATGDWIYANLPEGSNTISVLKLNENEWKDDFFYTATCSSSMFLKGHSGSIDMPAFDNYDGWECKQVTAYKFSKNMCVDLGLPSGNLWAYQNLGACLWKDAWDSDNPGEVNVYGNSYTWGKISDDVYAPDDLYEISGTQYDIAKFTLSGIYEWVMPTMNDYKELLDNCTISKGYYIDEANDINQRVAWIEGNNGERIFFPYYEGWGCMYISSTKYSSYGYVYYVDFYSGTIQYSQSRNQTRSLTPIVNYYIRPIIRPE